jgi:diaminopimelate epimerase
MTEIPFTKLHGAENDFLITWGEACPAVMLPETARMLCARTTGVGADGWMLAWKTSNGLRTRLFNSDGSEPEISGNGTRCAAAFAYLEGHASGTRVVIRTGAGDKTLKLMERRGQTFLFEMDMGEPRTEELHAKLYLAGRHWDACLLNVGNPQCVLFVDEFPENWRVAAAEAEAHQRFPKRTNVSVVKVLDRHCVEALFYERGAGETRSSGTGATGAAVAAVLRGQAESPVEVITPAGSLNLRWEKSLFLTGPAELICRGTYYANG